MGCGCGNKAGATGVPVVSHKRTIKTMQDRKADTNGSDYSTGTACRRCLVKHLSKAAVELSEYMEDSSRYDELSMCIGDIACAEDHAKGLGMGDDVDTIRAIRQALPTASQKDVDALRSIAVRLLSEDARAQEIKRMFDKSEARENLRRMKENIAALRDESNDAGAS